MLEVLQSSPQFQQQKELFDAMTAMCEGGVDADEMPNGTGEYGLVATNPIPCRTAFGSTTYLGRLRAADGAKVNYERLGSTQSSVSPQPIDIYNITHPTGRRLATLYISPYQKRISGKAPRAFMLAEDSFTQVAPVKHGETEQGDTDEVMNEPGQRFCAERLRDESIRRLFESSFPILAESGNSMLDLHEIKFGVPVVGDAPLILTLRLITFDEDAQNGTRRVRDIAEQDVILGSIPLPSGPSVISRDYRDAILNMEQIVRQRLTSMNIEALSPFDLLDNIPLTKCQWDVVDVPRRDQLRHEDIY